MTRAHASSPQDKTKKWTSWKGICMKHKSLHPRQGPQPPRPPSGLLCGAIHGALSSSKPCTSTSSLSWLFIHYYGSRDYFCFKFQNDFFSLGANTRWPELPLSEVNPSQTEHSPICKETIPPELHAFAYSKVLSSWHFWNDFFFFLTSSVIGKMSWYSLFSP